jgi:hypothetical protein
MQKQAKISMQTFVTGEIVRHGVESPTRSLRWGKYFRTLQAAALDGAEENPEMTKTQTTTRSEIPNARKNLYLHLKIKTIAPNTHARIGNGILESIAYIRNAGAPVL